MKKCSHIIYILIFFVLISLVIFPKSSNASTGEITLFDTGKTNELCGKIVKHKPTEFTSDVLAAYPCIDPYFEYQGFNTYKKLAEITPYMNELEKCERDDKGNINIKIQRFGELRYTPLTTISQSLSVNIGPDGKIISSSTISLDFDEIGLGLKEDVAMDIKKNNPEGNCIDRTKASEEEYILWGGKNLCKDNTNQIKVICQASAIDNKPKVSNAQNQVPIKPPSGKIDYNKQHYIDAVKKLIQKTGDQTYNHLFDLADGKNTYLDLILKWCEKYGIDPAIEIVKIRFESTFDPNAKSNVGAQGLAQFMPGTWKSGYYDANGNFIPYAIDANGDGVANPFNPNDAVATSVHHMRYLLNIIQSAMNTGSFSNYLSNPNQAYRLVLASYNAGYEAVQMYNGIPPYSETINYVINIMSDVHSLWGFLGKTTK